MTEIECPFCHGQAIPVSLSRSGQEVEWGACGACNREATAEAMTPILAELMRAEPPGKPTVRIYTRPGQATLAFRGIRKIIETPLWNHRIAAEIDAAIRGLRAIKRRDLPVIVFTSRPVEAVLNGRLTGPSGEVRDRCSAFMKETSETAQQVTVVAGSK